MSNPLSPFLIRIFSKDDKIIGSGFLVIDRYALTCVHVVADALGINRNTQDRPTKEIKIDFPLIASGKKLKANVSGWLPLHSADHEQPSGDEDIALLEILDELPDKCHPAKLVSSDVMAGTKFNTFGFPKDYDKGQPADGATKGSISDGCVVIEDPARTGYFVEQGFSGAPVWSISDNSVIGMIVSADKKSLRTAYMIPASLLRKEVMKTVFSHKYYFTKLDQHGKEIERQQLQANQFIEELTPDINLEMVSIPGDTFMMGSPETEKDRNANETLHKVTISPFYMGKFTITQEQWRVFAANKTLKVARDLEPDPARFKGDNRPVEQVRWEDAEEFCARLAKKTGRAYRLPTEAEWEYACRAGTTTPFAFGETIMPDIVNYDGNYPYAEAPKGKYRKETIPVGSLGVANAFGLFDMHGNVWEWCQDWYGEYEGKDLVDPTGLQNGEYRVLRGGSYNNNAKYCRAAFRDSTYSPSFGNYLLGFRCVISAGKM